MTLRSTLEKDRALDLYYGANKGAIASASHQLALFAGDPRTTGVEMDSVGAYARVTILNNGTNWPAASAGAKTCAEQTFPTSTAAWTVGGFAAAATHWQLFAVDTGEAGDCGPLDGDVLVTQAGVIVKRTVTVFYNPVF